MDKVSILVELTFSEEVSTDNQLQQVVNNIGQALINKAEYSGLAPIGVFTEKVEVFEKAYNNKFVHSSIHTDEPEIHTGQTQVVYGNRQK